jgi:hypothetical protein
MKKNRAKERGAAARGATFVVNISVALSLAVCAGQTRMCSLLRLRRAVSNAGSPLLPAWAHRLFARFQ